MNLAQLISQADANSYYSRSDADKYSAANSAGWLLYSLVTREMKGFFIKFDTTTVVLTPGQKSYNMPADFSSLLWLGERLTSTEDYHQMNPQRLGDVLSLQNSPALTSFYGYMNDTYSWTDSPFSFAGPYLLAPTGPTQQYQISVSPAVDQVRMTELAYVAKWLPITDSASIAMLPDEAYAPWLSLTTANLLDMNGDTQAVAYRNRAMGNGSLAGSMAEVSALLSWARQRQVVRQPRVRMFG